MSNSPDSGLSQSAEKTVAAATAGSMRLKFISLITLVVLLAIGALALSQPWFEFKFAPGYSAKDSIMVTGGEVSTVLISLLLANAALIFALAISGRALRYLFAVLQILLGITMFLAVNTARANPIATAANELAHLTGLGTVAGVSVAINSIAETIWPILSLIVTILLIVIGLAILITLAKWPKPTPKYDLDSSFAYNNNWSQLELDTDEDADTTKNLK